MKGHKSDCGGHFEGEGELQQLVLKTEAVVDDVLKPQVEHIQKHQEKIFQELLDVQTLADHIDLLQLQQQQRLREHKRQLQQLRELHVLRAAPAENERKASSAGSSESAEERNSSEDADPIPVEALVNVGCHLYMKAIGDDIGRILVNVGFQFFLEMTLKEAADFLRKKELLLTKKYEYWSVKCSGVKAQIQMVYDDNMKKEMCTHDGYFEGDMLKVSKFSVQLDVPKKGSCCFVVYGISNYLAYELCVFLCKTAFHRRQEERKHSC